MRYKYVKLEIACCYSDVFIKWYTAKVYISGVNYTLSLAGALALTIIVSRMSVKLK